MKRNELKELMIALHLTKDLEDTLEQKQIKGLSLSDKIKSFETLTQEDFEDEDDDGYSFRQYKRRLIGGYYNDLRWIAHERNQIMHKDGYLIPKFSHFQNILLLALRYLNPKYNDAFNMRRKRDLQDFFYEQPLFYLRYFIFNILPFLIPTLLLVFLNYEKISNLDYNQISTYILFGISIFVIFVVSRLIEAFFLVLETLISRLFQLLKILFYILHRYKITLSILLLSFLLWDSKLANIF